MANMSGRVTVCEDRAEINDTSCDKMRFGFEEFEWGNASNGYNNGNNNMLYL